MTYVSPREASKYYNVSEQTLRQWANIGKLKFKTTEGGHRRYEIVENIAGRTIIYARVSSRKQERDLNNQIGFLKKAYPEYEVISDIGSGINFKREGFRTILEQLFCRNIKEVVVTSDDRFARIGAGELFKWMFEYFGAKLTVLSKKRNVSAAEEFTEDLLEIITVFTARYHGKRKYKDEESKVLSELQAKGVSE